VARLTPVVAGAWLGLLLTVGLLAAPSAFQVLDRSGAAAMVARLFALEAPLSLVLALVTVVLERWRFRLEAKHVRPNRPIILALIALFCTVLGYYALQPMMAQARAGEGAWSFGQLHALSLALYAFKAIAVAALAWSATRPDRQDPEDLSGLRPS
jgi:hypothetical protein